MKTNNLEQPQMPETTMQIPFNGLKYLEKSAKWAKFLSIVGIIFAILMFFSGLFIKVIYNKLPENPEFETIPLLRNLPFFYIFCAIFCLLPCIFLNRFSNKMPKAILKQDSVYLSKAFKSLNFFFVIIGILTIISIMLLIIMLIVAVAMGGSGILQSAGGLETLSYYFSEITNAVC